MKIVIDAEIYKYRQELINYQRKEIEELKEKEQDLMRKLSRYQGASNHLAVVRDFTLNRIM